MARLLVIDDDPGMRDMLRATLVSAGHEVVVAANGKDAVGLVRAKPIDLVITDMLMPEKEGLETIQELRSQWPQFKIIAISGAPTEWNVLRMAEMVGALATLPKPFEPHEILVAVNKLLKA